jgi:hypothetical protein
VAELIIIKLFIAYEKARRALCTVGLFAGLLVRFSYPLFYYLGSYVEVGGGRLGIHFGEGSYYYFGNG